MSYNPVIYDEVAEFAAAAADRPLTAWQIDTLRRFGTSAVAPPALSKPDVNSYQITLSLTGLYRRDAVRFAKALRVLAEHELPGSGLSVTVAHVKAVGTDVEPC